MKIRLDSYSYNDKMIIYLTSQRELDAYANALSWQLYHAGIRPEQLKDANNWNTKNWDIIMQWLATNGEKYFLRKYIFRYKKNKISTKEARETFQSNVYMYLKQHYDEE